MIFVTKKVALYETSLEYTNLRTMRAPYFALRSSIFGGTIISSEIVRYGYVDCV